ncbi:uncharacterized protein [Littorina saxatilis]|uniref:Uncharacterized protein n=1 Tax=Littorina saxatilis TaxID=31220 RepID=A0AAN9G8C7_9CAEN
MWLFIAVLLPLATLHSSSGAAVERQTSSRHKRNSDNKVDLNALKEHLTSLEDGLSTFQKRSCELGLNSHHCQLNRLDSIVNMGDYLAGGYSPGKRSSQLPADISAMAEALIQNLNEQRQEVVKLRGVLDQLGEDSEKKKRTCEFRLGNHCLTEALDKAATQYFWLKSHHSPGRRKRQASALASVLPGQ